MSRFDDVARALAGGVSRREALRRLGGLVGAAVGAVFATAGAGKARGAGPNNCQDYCAQFYPPPRGRDTQNAYGQCVSTCNACVGDGGSPCGPTAACCDPDTETCENGVCEKLCTCPAGCCDPDNGDDSCSLRCSAGYHSACVDGCCECVRTCPAGSCRFDADCPSGFVCGANGCCVPACSDGMTLCPDGCVDLTMDSFNCGDCGTECLGSDTCVGGRCVSST
jgi:hypothetical protein